jgi:hypothetical protein
MEKALTILTCGVWPLQVTQRRVLIVFAVLDLAFIVYLVTPNDQVDFS